MTDRVVFDCTIYLQAAAREQGAAGECYRRVVQQKEAVLVASKEVLSEVRDVLDRPEIRKQFPSLTDQRVEAYVRAVEREAVVLEEVKATLKLERDRKDEPYLNLAKDTDASYIVAWDKDLRSLNGTQYLKDNLPELKAVVTPPEYLTILREREQGTTERGAKEKGPEKILIDKGIPDGPFKEGFKDYEVVTREQLGISEKVSAKDVVELAGLQGVKAIITTDPEVEEAAYDSPKVAALGIGGANVTNENILRIAMKDLKSETENRIEQKQVVEPPPPVMTAGRSM